jgi:hypothetical protein
MSLIKCNDIQNASGGIPTVKGQRLIPTAWVNFNGTGTVAIRDSEGVSSITDVNTGDYRVHFTSSMATANYAAFGFVSGASLKIIAGRSAAANQTTTEVRIGVRTVAGSWADDELISVVIMGGQS